MFTEMTSPSPMYAEQQYIYTVSQKRVLPNFGDNFVKSRPISKVHSLLERELNIKQKYIQRKFQISLNNLLQYLENITIRKTRYMGNKYQRSVQNFSDNHIISPLIFNIFFTAQRERNFIYLLCLYLNWLNIFL